MQVRDVMTKDPSCCTPDSKLGDVARMMVEQDCGSIPVVDSNASKKLVGVITDRDIVCRVVAKNKNPLELTVESCLSTPAVTVTPESSLEECCERMEKNQVRRVPVVNDKGCCCGIVAQADVATKAGTREAAEVVKDVSQPA